VGVVFLAGCDLFDPCAGPEYLNFAVVRHGMLPGGSPTFGSTAPLWGATEMMKPSDELQILFATQDELQPNVLELYAMDGASVTLVGEDMFVPTNGEGCAHNERHYALETLAAGDYTLVHRRKNGTGDPMNCVDLDCPWTIFDGDEAVTLTLSIR
jgi:hypothetical protein